MKFKKGEPRPPKAGRKKGSPNKVTVETRLIFKKLLDDLAPEVEGWIRQAAKKDPGEAANTVIRLGEFAVPKLARLQVDLRTVPIEEIAAELARREAAESGAEGQVLPGKPDPSPVH